MDFQIENKFYKVYLGNYCNRQLSLQLDENKVQKDPEFVFFP